MSRRPKLLDLFCCAGGAAMGYHRAGFDVTGIDNRPQPRYPFAFVQADALEYLAEHGHEYDAIHASPPCHDYTSLVSLSGANGTRWLLPATRDALRLSGRPWVIENVPGADLRADVRLCGAMFGLRTYRHRWFELGDPMFPPVLPHPRHRVRTSTYKRKRQYLEGYNISVTGNVGSWVGSRVLGIDWMIGAELSQAIPPVYTEVIGRHLLDQLATAGAP